MLELSHPDVSVSNRIAVVLQDDWQLPWMLGVVGFANKDGWALDHGIMLHEHAVVDEGDSGWVDQLPIFLGKARSGEKEVVGLPAAGRQ